MLNPGKGMPKLIHENTENNRETGTGIAACVYRYF
jgi:hypothetical protein